MLIISSIAAVRKLDLSFFFEDIEQDMKLGFVNLAKIVLLTWIAKAVKDESH